MPLLFSTASEVSSALMDIAGEFKNPRGVLWRVAEIDTSILSQIKIRAWDVSAVTEHKCQIIFSVTEGPDTCAVEGTICQNGHYASKLRNSAISALVHRFGHPPDEQPAEMVVSRDETVQQRMAAHTKAPVHQEAPAQPEIAATQQQTLIPPGFAQPPEMPTPTQTPVQPTPPATPDVQGDAESPSPQDVDLARRVEALEQNMSRWDSLINSYLGETLEQLTSQVDTIEERTTYLQQYAVSIELNLNLLWVLRFLIDKTRIRDPQIQQAADSAVAELRDYAAQLQQGLWNGSEHENARQAWADSCRMTLEKHGFSDFYGGQAETSGDAA